MGRVSFESRKRVWADRGTPEQRRGVCGALFGHSEAHLLGRHLGLESRCAKVLSLTVAMFSTARYWPQREREADNSLQMVGLPG